MISIHQDQPDTKWMWPLGPDIVEECQAVDELPKVDMDQWQLHFEPNDFNNEHGPLTLDSYRLSQDDMA